MATELISDPKRISETNQSLLIVSASPHIRSEVTISAIMYSVIIALLPTSLAGIYFFGWPALRVILVGVAGAVATEAVMQPLLGQKSTVWDGSAAVTGLLLALTLPPSVPWWMVLVGSALAISLGKSIYGGLGNNPFNPALIGRVIMLISWPVHLTQWHKPSYLFAAAMDAVTTASPLGILKGEGASAISQIRFFDLFIGNRAGCIGEVATWAIILGFGYLLWKEYISWHIPVSCLAAVFLVSGLAWYLDPAKFAHPLFHLMGGGLMLGACFMATDMVTSPVSGLGMIIYGFGIGFITIMVRLFGGSPEGISFAILFMNAVCPLIDRYTKPKAFGRKSR